MNDTGKKILELLGIDFNGREIQKVKIDVYWPDARTFFEIQEMSGNTYSRRFVVKDDAPETIQSGSATPVDPRPMPGALEYCERVPFVEVESPAVIPVGASSCPECSGRGEIQLFTSTVPCKCCGGG